MSAIKRIAIIGATGMLGIPVTEALLDAGFEITALARKPEAAKAVLPEATKMVEADVRDEASLRRGLAGQDGLYLNLSIAPNERRTAFHTEQQGLDHILSAAHATGIKRCLLVCDGARQSEPLVCRSFGAAPFGASKARAFPTRSSIRRTSWRRCHSGT